MISTAAKLPIVDNTLEQLKAIQIFFNTSLKRESLLTHIVDKECFNSKRSVLLGMCNEEIKNVRGLRTSTPWRGAYSVPRPPPLPQLNRLGREAASYTPLRGVRRDR